MESVNTAKLTERAARLNNWIKLHCGFPNVTLQPMTPDASLRRYYRIQSGNQHYVIMDAPPPERCGPFVAIADSLRGIGLMTPVIFQADISNGFLLLTDFGNQTYLQTLNDNNADLLYRQALDALSVLQALRYVRGHPIPPFTAEFMQQEWLWHKDWFLQRYCGVDLHGAEPALNNCYNILVDSAVSQPQVFMHRDYHAANLMVLPANNPGILDFQDAFIGPITYDLASLLRDSYIAWPISQVETWVNYYWQQLTKLDVITVSETVFRRWFDLMGLQRHLKTLFTFSRKKLRDNHPQYLRHIPRVLTYIVSVSANYPELNALHEFYKDQVILPCEP